MLQRDIENIGHLSAQVTSEYYVLSPHRSENSHLIQVSEYNYNSPYTSFRL